MRAAAAEFRNSAWEALTSNQDRGLRSPPIRRALPWRGAKPPKKSYLRSLPYSRERERKSASLSRCTTRNESEEKKEKRAPKGFLRSQSIDVDVKGIAPVVYSSGCGNKNRKCVVLVHAPFPSCAEFPWGLVVLCWFGSRALVRMEARDYVLRTSCVRVLRFVTAYSSCSGDIVSLSE